MTAEQLGRLFEAFTQAEASTTRKYGGTGPGAGDHPPLLPDDGRRHTVESEPGQGSTFTIRLPGRRRRRPARRRARPTTAAARRRRRRPGSLVLVIDDDPTVRDLMRRSLDKEGFRVEHAAGGEEGLRLARELRPDAITLDVMMPGMDGWAVLAALKSDPELAEIPVVMVTIVDDKNLGYALGAADYLTKPIDRERLAAVLTKHRRDARRRHGAGGRGRRGQPRRLVRADAREATAGRSSRPRTAGSGLERVARGAGPT